MSEPFAFRHLNRLVGLFVITSAAVLLAGVVLIGRARHWLSKEFTVTVAFDRNNLGLLRSGLPVKIQGTDAGEVESARQDAEHTIARVILREEFRDQLRSDAKAIIHTPIAGFLGETYIEIWPGQEEAPFSVAEGLITQLPGDDLLQQARASITSFGQASGQLRDLIAENRVAITGAVESVRRTAENVAKLVEDNRKAVNDALVRMEAMSREVAEAVAENRPNIKATTEAMPGAVEAVRAGATAFEDTSARTAVAADELAAAARATSETITENRDELSLALADLRRLMADAQVMAQDMQVITAQVASGQGSLGKLVMEDTAHDKAVELADNANQTLTDFQPILTTISNVKLFLGVSGGGNLDSGVTTGSAYLRLEPNASKFYQGGVTYRAAPRDLDSENETSEGFPVDFDLLLGWRFFAKDDGNYWLSLGGGILESRLGGVIGSQLWSDRLGVLTLIRGKHDSRPTTDRRYEEGNVLVRATLSVRMAWRVFAEVGGDDLADEPGWWLGGRVELLDNDLRNLTTFGPLFR